MDRDCIEDEAITAAENVAELLDWHDLSPGEVELKNQACEGFGVGTSRRFGPVDSRIPAVGVFCGCRVWSEKAADGEIRYVLFGLPADVARARHLYEPVERVSTTEAELFKRFRPYAEHRSGDCRGTTQAGRTSGSARHVKGGLRQP